MGYGATFWAGIDRLLIGARASDVMALTEFDEGPLPADWIGELERRDIQVYRDIHRDAACAVLRDYGAHADGGSRRRSEERRVGTEVGGQCGARVWQDHEKHKEGY